MMRHLMISDAVHQSPAPGTRRVLFQGDTVTFTLEVSAAAGPGTAWVRTNIGNGLVARSETIREVEAGEAPLGRDWSDLPMQAAGEGRYGLTLGLSEAGHFEAKAYFLPQAGDDPLWPPGANMALNVKPVAGFCGATIYNAFVRQFGPHKDGRFRPAADEATQKALDAQGYAVIPPSGTFRALIRELDHITGSLGCRFVQLLPIHPTPTTYGRMGRFGSPYAALSFTEVDPALAEFDPRATPLDQFLELVDQVHRRDARLILDIAINHTGWAASLHASHPEWLARTAEGAIEKPGAWGVVWEDLTRLDWSRRDLWQYMAGVFLMWCRRGADGFRCDAGYMIPGAAWRYMTARVRDEYPETIFLLEGLGGEVSVTRELLCHNGFDWAYSELFQNYDRGQVEGYAAAAAGVSSEDGTLVHYAETHDNNRLASRSQSWAAMRTHLTALLAANGAFGFANGVEWFATEKIDVHDARSLAWGASPNQVEEIGRLARILRTHPAFAHPATLAFVGGGPGEFVAVARCHVPSGRRVLVLVNLDPEHEMMVKWNAAAAGIAGPRLYDLVSGRPVDARERDGTWGLVLGPGRAACLSPDPRDLEAVDAAASRGEPPALLHRRLRARALALIEARGGAVPDDAALDRAARALPADPVAFDGSLAPGAEPRVVTWRWSVDARREVMIPPGHALLVRAPHPFRVEVRGDAGAQGARTGGIGDRDGGGERTWATAVSAPGADADHFALLGPWPEPAASSLLGLVVTVYAPRNTEHATGPLLLLAGGAAASMAMVFDRATCLAEPLLTLATNGRGAMCRARVAWGGLESRYDALLAANLHPDFPVDRRVMLSRCRAWVVHQGMSHPIGTDSLVRLGFDYDSRSCWEYRIPLGRGRQIGLMIALELVPGENLLRIHFHRPRAGTGPDALEDATPVRLILRPDVEDRSFHETTKAFAGAERDWPRAVTAGLRGFKFSPSPPRRLEVLCEAGEFVLEPQWQYMVHRPIEARRGLDPDSDLFSPGWFRVSLTGGQTATLTALAAEADVPQQPRPTPHWVPGWFDAHPPRLGFRQALDRALDQYVVRRGDFHTVIAGYPWFLDWGRDTLIVARGLVAAGRHDQVRAILQQFARFEDRGTLPNMIRGAEASDRDTSDAPLWLYVACADLLAAQGDGALAADCGGRTLRDVLVGLARALTAGASNGVRMDQESGLLFSPAHFTWMDTNHPAGSPREGYPIEIQALWQAALSLLARIDSAGGWAELAARVRASIGRLYPLPAGYLSDCLHGRPGTPAAAAVRDDALRPNQLLAVTLGAVEDPQLQRGILAACSELLVPGAIRSLADRSVDPPLEIRHMGALLGDPVRPYRGRYEGDEDTRRKPAYHNGTAWTWLYPSYAEAWATVYGESGRGTAFAWLAGSNRLADTTCVGHIPEVVDGDAPHRQRGCDAQAWGVSELLRVWVLLGGN
jgi:starch synthase (maltosyl-transferring)